MKLVSESVDYFVNDNLQKLEDLTKEVARLSKKYQEEVFYTQANPDTDVLINRMAALEDRFKIPGGLLQKIDWHKNPGMSLFDDISSIVWDFIPPDQEEIKEMLKLYSLVGLTEDELLELWIQYSEKLIKYFSSAIKRANLEP